MDQRESIQKVFFGPFCLINEHEWDFKNSLRAGAPAYLFFFPSVSTKKWTQGPYFEKGQAKGENHVKTIVCHIYLLAFLFRKNE
jgi:hypothetical protein